MAASRGSEVKAKGSSYQELPLEASEKNHACPVKDDGTCVKSGESSLEQAFQLPDVV
jgi:hypothetical protein